MIWAYGPFYGVITPEIQGSLAQNLRLYMAEGSVKRVRPSRRGWPISADTNRCRFHSYRQPSACRPFSQRRKVMNRVGVTPVGIVEIESYEHAGGSWIALTPRPLGKPANPRPPRTSSLSLGGAQELAERLLTKVDDLRRGDMGAYPEP